MYAQYDIDFLSILILIIVLVNNFKNGGESLIKRGIFRAMIICDMALLLLDAVILMIYGMPGPFVHVLIEILQAYFFVLCSLFCLLWAVYCTRHTGQKHSIIHLLVLSIPLFFLIVMLLTNYANGKIYMVTENNTYQRGEWFHITSVCAYSYVLYTIIHILKNRKQFSKNEYYPYLIFPLLPMVVGIIQLAFSLDVLIVWPSTAISILIMQLYVLDEKMNLDHLTGLYNRKYLDGLIEDMLQFNRINYGSKRKKSFAALMLDIDNFKSINDWYGHVEGDNAIVHAADILKGSVRKNDFVSRFGGDEFLIILDHCVQDTPDRVIKRIKDNVRRFNNEHKLPYKIDFSIGYRIFDNPIGLTSKHIISSIDDLMYINKQSKLD